MNLIETQEMRRRIEGASVARLATVGPDGRPHIVPITFAPTEDALYFAVDQKPKKSADLQRLRNIEANPAVSVLFDHYEDDWSRLWWVRIDGSARIVRDGDELETAISLLSRRYAQYRSVRPPGPAVAIHIERMMGWSAS
jgi:PPOX class probable F420-dependent enzyme